MNTRWIEAISLRWYCLPWQSKLQPSVLEISLSSTGLWVFQHSFLGQELESCIPLSYAQGDKKKKKRSFKWLLRPLLGFSVLFSCINVSKQVFSSIHTSRGSPIHSCQTAFIQVFSFIQRWGFLCRSCSFTSNS